MADSFTITYSFRLPDRHRETFKLVFDARTVELSSLPINEAPPWTKLEYEQCPHCQLNPATDPHCPVALNLVPVIERFNHLMSFDRLLVLVVSAERQVMQKTSVQVGISSLMGLLIAGSRCPITHFFKPMARFHLPFANKNETLWRAAATYFMAHYFRQERLQSNDLELSGLVKIYNDVGRLNDALAERLRRAAKTDSAINALVHLDVFAKFLTPPLDDSLLQIKPLFEPYLVKGKH